MSQPPYGVPPQPGQPAAPPAYLGGAPAPGYGGPVVFGGAGPLAPPSKPRSVGLVMGIITVLALILMVVVVWVITANN